MSVMNDGLTVVEAALGLPRMEACMPPKVPAPKPGPCPGSKRGSGLVRKAAAPKVTARKQPPKLPPQPDVKVLDRLQDVAPTGFDWMKSPDIDRRAKGFWFGQLGDQQRIRQVFRNIEAGREPLDGVDTSGRVSFYSNAQSYQSVLDGGFEPSTTEQDMRNDLVSAGRWVASQMRDPKPSTQPLYRGIRMRSSELPQPGDRFSTDIASWAEERRWADHFARQPEDEKLGRVGDLEVVMRMQGPKRTVPLGSNYLDEHLAGGQYEVVSVSGKGRKRTITIREVQ